MKSHPRHKLRLIILTAAATASANNFSILSEEKAKILLRQFGYLGNHRSETHSLRIESSVDPTIRLGRSGFPYSAYHENPQNFTSSQNSQNQYKTALKELQYFYRLPITGILDEQTQNILTRPRCGTSDKLPQDLQDIIGRSKRYVVGSVSWFDHGFKNPITFGLENTADPLLTKKETCIAILRAFKMWEQQANIRFQEINYSL